MSKAYVYFYDKIIDNEVMLPDNILKHCNQKKVMNKRLISLSNYYMLKIKLKELYNIDISKLYFENNKPIIDGIYISLAHSDKYYGFIISDDSVGIDIEGIINNDKLAKKILDADEFKDYLSNNLILTEKWCLLEAYYKMFGNMEIDYNSFKNKTIFKFNDNIILAIGNYDEVKIYFNDGVIL